MNTTKLTLVSSQESINESNQPNANLVLVESESLPWNELVTQTDFIKSKLMEIKREVERVKHLVDDFEKQN